MAIKAFRQTGEELFFPFAKWETVSPMAPLAIGSASLGYTVLGSTVKEKDLGITISADMKVSEQCGIAASKGNQIF